ncbi:MAG: HAMP domain-containing histidine kinase [Lachnospiraceae bacterium]|nr:HAMP domain-containing histidine kinase [Lachnospiraceae bacterium]
MRIEMIALIVICLGLMFLLAGILRQIKKINQVLDEIIEGETDRRIIIGKYSFLSDTCYKFNQIMMDNKERIIQTKRLERRNEKLMTSLSHDIRTPLTSIIGHLDAVHYQYVHGEMNAESVRQAREKAYVLKDYLDDLFQWFKLGSKEEKAEMEPLDIVEETRAVFANWVAAFESNGISYDFVSDMDEIQTGMDRVFYERIVNNLLKNAMEHSGASKIWIEIVQTGITVAVKICDNGVGIPEKEIPFVFDRLYKADDARSSKGSGLGLAIARELVLLQGGKIFVESQKKGISFVMEFPILENIGEG